MIFPHKLGCSDGVLFITKTVTGITEVVIILFIINVCDDLYLVHNHYFLGMELNSTTGDLLL